MFICELADQFSEDSLGRFARVTRPQLQDFTEHPETIVQKTHFTALVVIPAHRLLEQAQPRLMREEEQLHVEAETIDLRALDDRTRRGHAEGFEAALRVGKRQPGQEAHEAVKDPINFRSSARDPKTMS